MPSLEREGPAAGPTIQGFSGNGFVVDGLPYLSGVKLTPRAAFAWQAPPIDQLGPDALRDLLTLSPTPEFLLLGTGARLRRPPKPIFDLIEQYDIGVELMDSRAAARVWGVLRSEDRWIAAALLPLDYR